MPKALSKVKVPALLILALILLLAMLRLGVWQLERAAQKQTLLDQITWRAKKTETPLWSLSPLSSDKHRYRRVSMVGQYQVDKSVFIDNQVVEGQVGYWVFTPFKLARNDDIVMVNRGWVSVGDSRAKLPEIDTPSYSIRLKGRLNLPPAQPPLWDADYAVNQGKVWAYLPLDEYAAQMQLTVLPLVVELAPEKKGDSQFKRVWSDINDEWVAKHQGYAFQWFAMALAFFVACLVLLVRQVKRID